MSLARAAHPRSGPSGLGAGEDDVAADPAPHDMDVTSPDRSAVLEGRTAVVCPGHLEDSLGTLDSLDPETRTESTAAFEVLDELLHGVEEALLLVGGELLEVPAEARSGLEGGHSLSIPMESSQYRRSAS